MFFSPDSISQSKLTMGHYREWANEIANTYLNSGVAPTETLRKIASSEELLPHQIQTLASEANKVIHQSKFASAEEKYHAADFPLIDYREVLRDLQLDGGDKIAVHLPPPVLSSPDVDAHELWGIKPEKMDKTASVKHGLNKVAQKTELLQQKCEDRMVMAKYATTAAEREFIKQARAYVLNGESSAERMQIFGQLERLLTECAPKFAAGWEAIAKTAAVLRGEGLLTSEHGEKAIDYFIMKKEADCKAPEELISQYLNARVINGNHSLYITLKTFRDRVHELENSVQNQQIVNDKVQILEQRIRAL